MAKRSAKQILQDAQRKENELLKSIKEAPPYVKISVHDEFLDSQAEVLDYGINTPNPEGFCGEIAMEWRFETPVLVGNACSRYDQYGNEIFVPIQFGNNYVIPGSTVRGAIRAVCEILGFGGREDGAPDFVDQLFGFVDESGSDTLAQKGRIAFGHLTLANPQDIVTSRPNDGPIQICQMVPKNKGRFRRRYQPKYLKGIPAIVKHRQIIKELTASGQSEDGSPKSPKLLTPIKLLQPSNETDELVFKGHLKMHNCTRAEIGLILASLTHLGFPKKLFRHMIGRAKSIGLGQVRIKTLNIDMQPNLNTIIVPTALPQELPSTENEGWLDTGSQSMKYYLDEYLNYLGNHIEGFEKKASIREFFKYSGIYK